MTKTDAFELKQWLKPSPTPAAWVMKGWFELRPTMEQYSVLPRRTCWTEGPENMFYIDIELTATGTD